MSRKGISIGLIALLLIVIVLAAFLPLPGIAVPDQNRQLTILFTHDLHSHFDPNKVVNEQDEVVLLGVSRDWQLLLRGRRPRIPVGCWWWMQATSAWAP